VIQVSSAAFLSLIGARQVSAVHTKRLDLVASKLGQSFRIWFKSHEYALNNASFLPFRSPLLNCTATNLGTVSTVNCSGRGRFFLVVSIKAVVVNIFVFIIFIEVAVELQFNS